MDRSEIENLTEVHKNFKRKDLLDKALTNDDFISFRSNNQKHEIVVFTDVDCGYCRKFHSEIDQYNGLGITVNYVAFPRSGIESESFNKIVGAWCSKDAKNILTEQKKGSEPIIEQCEDHPVREHFTLGQRIGITGTPAIVTSDGRLLPGYLPADELLLRIEEGE